MEDYVTKKQHDDEIKKLMDKTSKESLFVWVNVLVLFVLSYAMFMHIDYKSLQLKKNINAMMINEGIPPIPTRGEPSLKTLRKWVASNKMEATDGCPVTLSGTCQHGHPSWLVHLGLIPKDLAASNENLLFLEPISETPTLEQLREWSNAGGCHATDGCWVEENGMCKHGYVSWLVYMGFQPLGEYSQQMD